MAYDLVLRDACVVDGTGASPVVADVAIRGDRVAALGRVTGPATIEIDARGMIAAPGFIDVHTHDDRLVLLEPAVGPKVSQGVTTVVTGNCGISLAPMTRAGEPVPPLTLLGGRRDLFQASFAAYAAAVRGAPPAVNVVPFVGHSALRACAVADLGRAATGAEIEAMGRLLDEAMAAGAFGMSTGLYYPPAQAASPAEVEALLARVATAGGLQTTHLRDEGDGLIEALDEAIGSARRGGLPLVVSHVKCAAPRMWGRAAEVLARIDAAAAHQEIAFDVYPYEASSTMLRPDRLRGARRVVVSWSDTHPELAGQDLDAIAGCWCCSPEEAAHRLSPGGAIYYKMQERDVRRILAHPGAMIGSDGLPHDQHPHPRLWGTFPRVLGHYVRELKLMGLPEAVRRMTALPAAVFGLADRGVLAEGMLADVTLFDADLVLDEATYDAPTRPARGIRLVLVNGEPVWEDGAATGRRPGRLLRREPALTRSGRRPAHPAPAA